MPIGHWIFILGSISIIFFGIYPKSLPKTQTESYTKLLTQSIFPNILLSGSNLPDREYGYTILDGKIDIQRGPKSIEKYIFSHTQTYMPHAHMQQHITSITYPDYGTRTGQMLSSGTEKIRWIDTPQKSSIDTVTVQLFERLAHKRIKEDISISTHIQSILPNISERHTFFHLPYEIGNILRDINLFTGDTISPIFTATDSYYKLQCIPNTHTSQGILQNCNAQLYTDTPRLEIQDIVIDGHTYSYTLIWTPTTMTLEAYTDNKQTVHRFIRDVRTNKQETQEILRHYEHIFSGKIYTDLSAKIQPFTDTVINTKTATETNTSQRSRNARGRWQGIGFMGQGIYTWKQTPPIRIIFPISYVLLSQLLTDNYGIQTLLQSGIDLAE